MRRLAPLAALAALCLVPSAAAKEFTTVVLVGARGDSIELHPEPSALDVLFSPAGDAAPHGGYVRVFLLAPGGLPGIPGRFYPVSGAACFSWNQARPASPPCARPDRSLFADAESLARFHGAPTTLRRLAFRGRIRPVFNVNVAVEMAFDRYARSRAARKPTRCLPFTAAWRGPAASSRARRFCLSPRGAFARGRLYPLGTGPWSIVWGNLPWTER